MLLMLEIFLKLVRRRPIMLMETEGAQDEATHFPKTLGLFLQDIPTEGLK